MKNKCLRIKKVKFVNLNFQSTLSMIYEHLFHCVVFGQKTRAFPKIKQKRHRSQKMLNYKH